MDDSHVIHSRHVVTPRSQNAKHQLLEPDDLELAKCTLQIISTSFYSVQDGKEHITSELSSKIKSNDDWMV